MTDASTLMLPNQTAVSTDCMFNLKASSIRARLLPLDSVINGVKAHMMLTVSKDRRQDSYRFVLFISICMYNEAYCCK